MDAKFKTEIYDRFLGIDNVNDSTKIITRDTIKRVSIASVRLLQAENVDIHADYHLSRCTGYDLFKSGKYTSIWSNDEICLAINLGDLVRIYPSSDTEILVQGVGTDPMSYVQVKSGEDIIIYYTNGKVIGKIQDGVASSLSTPTKEFKEKLPPGNIIRFFQGSLHIINGNTQYISDVLNRDVYDSRWGWKLYESSVTMFEPVREGIYVADAYDVYFMKRTGSTDQAAAQPIFKLDKIYNSPVIPGTPCKLFNVTSPEGKKHEEAIIWISGNTLCLGGDDGSIEEIRSDIYAVPSSVSGCSMFRTEGDLNQYIAIVK